MQVKSTQKPKRKTGKPGRPKESRLSQKELIKLRVRRFRERKRGQDNLVLVQVWIPKHQRQLLKSVLRQTEDLSTAATEAFALLIEGRKGTQLPTPAGKRGVALNQQQQRPPL